MKVKKVHIAIKSEERFWQDFKNRVGEFAQAAQKGKEIKGHPDTLVFGSLAEIAQVLTPQRMELLGVIRRHRPESTKELATLAARDIESVDEDVRALELYGLIDTEKNEGPRHGQLTADYERLDLQVHL